MENIEIYNTAKRFEADNMWLEAAQQWDKLGRKDDYGACMLIHNSNKAGDIYRSRIENELGPEPDKCDNPHAWVKWYDGMTKIYNEQFN